MELKYLFFLLFLISSCKPIEKPLFQFDLSSIEENCISLSDLADEITYTPLENAIQLGMIYDYHYPKFVNNSIFLFENNIGILVFNRNGNYLRKIGNIGRGPGEYIHGLSFAVDEKTESVYINDTRDIIKVYSQTGFFLRSFSAQKYGGSIDAIEVHNSKVFISYNPQFDDAKYEWILLDTLGNLVKKKERTSPVFNSNWLAGGGTYLFDNNISYWNQYVDTIFSISPYLKIKPSFIISQGEFRLPKSNFDIFKQVSKYMTINQILETKHFLMVRYSFYKEKNGFVLIDKINGKSSLSYWDTYSSGSILNDLDGGIKFLPQSYFVENDREYLIEVIDPFQIKNHVTSDEFRNSTPKYFEKKKELEILANSLKETDNPVLMIVRLKK